MPQEITEVAKPTRRRVDRITFSIPAILMASLFWVMPHEIYLQLVIRLSKILMISRKEQEQRNKLELLLNFRIFSTAKKDNYIPVDSLCRSGFISNLVPWPICLVEQPYRYRWYSCIRMLPLGPLVWLWDFAHQLKESGERFGALGGSGVY